MAQSIWLLVMKNNPKVLSLFSGVGGLDLGLERAGFKTMFQCEWDKNAANILSLHWPDVPRWGDVSTLKAKDVLEYGCPDVVAWGSPCQDLSVVGSRSGLSGSKSGLFYEGMRIIRELREETNGKYPKVSIWENVAGALSSNKGQDFGVILNEMVDAGALGIEWAVLDAQYFGVPQRRRRVFLASVFNSDSAKKCPPKIFPVGKSHDGNPTEDRFFTFYSTQGKQDRFTQGICTTLKAVGPACIATSRMRPRKFTPVECERLMSWPDNWTASVSDTERYRQCGNGVVSNVAEWVGHRLKGLCV